MPVALLDVNVLVALGWSDHAHSAAAHRWLRANVGQSWATCTVTQLGFTRISINPRIVGAAFSSAEVLGLLRSVIAIPGHVFWPEIGIANQPVADWDNIRGHHQVTDLYLALLAKHHGGRFITFDRAAGCLLPSHVEVI